MGGGEGWGILYIKASVVQWKDRPWRPEFGLEIGRFFLFLWSTEAVMGGRARSAPLGVAMRPKRRVRTVHGLAREAKTH